MKELAHQFAKQAVKIVQPTNEDILQAAKTYFVLKKLLAQEKGDALIRNGVPGTAAGYGIRNTRRRLELAYGPAGLVSIRSAVNSGTTVTISIPTV